MAVVVNIEGIDRSSEITFGSLRIVDAINNANDTCQFEVKKYGSHTWAPLVNDEIEVIVDGVKTYGGVIVSIDRDMEGHATVSLSVQCKDYSQYLDRHLITERYTDMTVKEIIDDLIFRYAAADGFTGANVGGDTLDVASIAFNELTFTEALQKIAQLTTYSWYVDQDKDIHFFKKSEELAPFNLTNTSANYIFDTLSINSDISQLRNKVKVRGGEGISDARTKLLAGNGETDTFGTDHKFAELPTVLVNGVAKTVGVDYLEKDIDYQVMWNFAQKYIRFTAGNIPPAVATLGDTNISVTGLPLKPIVVQVVDAASVAKYGVYEFRKINDGIRSRDEALKFAQAELESYADSLRSGGFQTYTPGLRSGQTIRITNTLLEVDEDFLIQRVNFQQLSTTAYIYRVEVATLKVVSILDVLQKLLNEERISEGEDETLLNFIQLSDEFTMTDAITNKVKTTTQNYVWEQSNPLSDSYPNPVIWDKFTWG